MSTPILERLGKCLSGLQTFHRQVQHAGQVTRQHFEALEVCFNLLCRGSGVMHWAVEQNIEMQWEAQTGRAQELIEELEGLEVCNPLCVATTKSFFYTTHSQRTSNLVLLIQKFPRRLNKDGWRIPTSERLSSACRCVRCFESTQEISGAC